MEGKKFLFVFLITLSLLPPIVSSVSIQSISTDSDSYLPGEEVKISSVISNDEGRPVEDHTIEVAVLWTPDKYASTGRSTVYKERFPLEIEEGGERKFINTWKVPSQEKAGLHRLFLVVYNPNENMKAIGSIFFRVNETDQEVKNVAFEDLRFYQGDRTGWGLQGFHVKPGEPMEIEVQLNNTGDVDISDILSADFLYTFDRSRSGGRAEKNITLGSGDMKIFRLKINAPETPTTYTPVIKIGDPEPISQVKGRIVVEGNSARILDAGTNKLAYQRGDNVIISVDVIGPADYSGIIQNAILEYNITDEKGAILEGSKNVNLGGEINSVTIQKRSPRNFKDYNLSLVLKKNGNIFNTYFMSYEGGELPEKERPLFLYIIAGVIGLGIIVAGVIYLWRRKK